MNNTCGCCEGIQKLTPVKITNRPGLKALDYRAGTYVTFFETMLARLSSLNLQAWGQSGKRNPLLDLKTRAVEDPSIALLDVWAIVTDILSFYQERIANEGYLLTATERRSVLELSRLVGYALRPGVAANVFLAFTMEKDFRGEIPAGVRAQNIPGPGELPQSFETVEPLMGRSEWNEMKPRMTRPQYIKDDSKVIYLKGVQTNLKRNDFILIDYGNKTIPVPKRILEVESDALADHTKVTLEILAPSMPEPPTTQKSVIDILLRVPGTETFPPQNTTRLARNLPASFKGKSDLGLQLLTRLEYNLKKDLYPALSNAAVTESSPVKVYALRLTASLFGHDVPRRIRILTNGEYQVIGEWPVVEINDQKQRIKHEEPKVVYLDKSYDQILPGSWILVKTISTTITNEEVTVAKVKNSNASILRAEYGLVGKTTRIELADPTNEALSISWMKSSTILDEIGISQEDNNRHFEAIRSATVYAQSELLDLAEEPITDDIGKDDPDKGRRIELDKVYEDLESGRWLVVSGERVDIEGVKGVMAGELIMLAGVTQEVQKIKDNAEEKDLPGDTTHTFLEFANSLAYRYKRDTVTINANVVRATHGETHPEVLGSGEGSKTFQKFSLQKLPLTYISATTPSGIENSLEVRVNDILWNEADSLVGLGPTERKYITQRDDEGKTAIIFGNGMEGAVPPTGIENVRAVYRVGIGKSGNVAARTISLLAARPLGVKGVLNPLPATGGADPESRDQAQVNATIHLKALDRAVSVQDYADFARAFTGIGKAVAARISDGRRELVHLTIAGAKDIPINKQSDLYRNLLQALYHFGDPHQAIQVDMRELKLLVMSANIKLLGEYLWEKVEPQIRAALLDSFSFDRRELGQDVTYSEVIRAMQTVPGVDYVDIDKLGALDTTTILNNLDKLEEVINTLPEPRTQPRIIAELARVDFTKVNPEERIQPAQLIYLTPDIKDTIILKGKTK